MSAAEDMLAYHIRAANLLTPEREYRFNAERRWRFDFAWPGLKIAAEVEGGAFTGGRHTRGTGFEKDAEKYNQAALQGWRLFRFTPSMVRGGSAIATLERALERVA